MRSSANLTRLALSHNDVERFKHRHGDNNGGGDQQQYEHSEAQRAMAMLTVEPPDPNPRFSALINLVAPDAVGADLGTKLGLKVAQTLTEVGSHRGRC